MPRPVRHAGMNLPTGTTTARTRRELPVQQSELRWVRHITVSVKQSAQMTILRLAVRELPTSDALAVGVHDGVLVAGGRVRVRGQSQLARLPRPTRRLRRDQRLGATRRVPVEAGGGAVKPPNAIVSPATGPPTLTHTQPHTTTSRSGASPQKPRTHAPNPTPSSTRQQTLPARRERWFDRAAALKPTPARLTERRSRSTVCAKSGSGFVPTCPTPGGNSSVTLGLTPGGASPEQLPEMRGLRECRSSGGKGALFGRWRSTAGSRPMRRRARRPRRLPLEGRSSRGSCRRLDATGPGPGAVSLQRVAQSQGGSHRPGRGTGGAQCEMVERCLK